MNTTSLASAPPSLAGVLTALAPHTEVLDAEQWGTLRSAIDGLAPSLAAAREADRNLRIAVVGQMKAGKSSFLNAAFFNRDLLPKADTPMTAALTRITYAPTTRAEVVFYNADDWAGIEQRAQDYTIQYRQEEQRLIDENRTSPFAAPRQPTRKEVEAKIDSACIASRELVDKARERGLDVALYLGKTHELPALADPADLAQALHEYVGSGGQFTALTKMSTLYVNDQRLEGLEIIDTPGFNDPVVSRGQQTREHLKRCDVVFLLSTVSQFITNSDMALVRNQLSAAGIGDKAIFLVGSQRDVALRQDAGIARTADAMAASYPPEQRPAVKVAAMIQLLDKKMAAHAVETLDRQATLTGLDEASKAILLALRKEPPHFVSAWSWMMAKGLEEKNLSPDDQDQLDKLCRDTNFAFDPNSLRQLSNIPRLQQKVLAQRERKDQLLADKESLLIKGVASQVRSSLAELKKSLMERGERIRTGNIKGLEAMEADAVKRMKNGRAKLENVFDEQVVKARQRFALLKTDIRQKSSQYSRVETLREVENVSYSVSTSNWYNPFSWGSSETRHREIVTLYADTQDCIEKLVTFATDTTHALQREVINCVDLAALRRSVSQQAMALFDTSSADFDAEMMLVDVEKSLRRITIPEVNFGQKDYTQAITSQFSSHRVSESQIGGLQTAQTAAVAAILSDLEREVSAKVSEITSKLESTGSTFVTTLTQDIQKSLETLRADIANKEQTLQAHARALAVIDQAQSQS
jgi:predicted GTPase